MSKSSKIRWRERDTQQLAKKVKNFNAKLTRLTKKNPALAEILPDRVSMKDLRGDITTRQEYNRVIKALSSFTEKGAEEVVTGKSGVTTTKWQLQQVKKAVAIENRRRKKQADTLKTAPVTIGGKVYTNVRRMAGMQALQPLQVRLDTRSQTSWENFSRYMERQMLGGGQADEQRYFQACVSCWSGMCSDQQVTLLKTHMQQVGIGKCLKAYYNGVDELRMQCTPINFLFQWLSRMFSIPSIALQVCLSSTRHGSHGIRAGISKLHRETSIRLRVKPWENTIQQILRQKQLNQLLYGVGEYLL